MICVTIGRGRHSSLAEEWNAAAEAGVDLVELRLDCLRREPDLKRVLAKRPTPMVVTLRRGADGGLWRGPEEKRQGLLREAIALGIDYVDLEVDIASKIRRYGKTKRIVSYHNFTEVPADLKDIAHQCDEADADVVKLAVRAETIAEASEILKLAAGSPVPMIAVGMGELGYFTRVLSKKFGAPWAYAGFNPERTFAPGMPIYRDLTRDYFYSEINAETEIYAVIGDPIGHSLSPAIHNAAFRHLGLNKVLVPFLIPAGELRESLKAVDWLDLKGFSVTIPHKENIIPLLKKMDNAVDRTKSCNTVVVVDGDKIGYNTDYRAAMESLKAALGGRSDDDDASPLSEKHVLILGAGGVARAIAYGCRRRGAIVSISNRHSERATALAAEVGCQAVDWGQRVATLAQIIINCTPVGMHPNVDDTPMPPAGFNKPNMLVFDTVYHPENTMFLKLARERGCQTVTGVDMFIRQAGLQFKLYTGLDAPGDLMRDVVRRKLGPIRE